MSGDMKIESLTGSRKFSVDEIGDVIRNKRNLIYLFELNGKLIRLFVTTTTNGNTSVPQEGS